MVYRQRQSKPAGLRDENCSGGQTRSIEGGDDNGLATDANITRNDDSHGHNLEEHDQTESSRDTRHSDFSVRVTIEERK